MKLSCNVQGLLLPTVKLDLTALMATSSNLFELKAGSTCGVQKVIELN